MTAQAPIAGEPLGSEGEGIASSSDASSSLTAVVAGFYGRMQRVATRLLTKRNTGTVVLVRKTSVDNGDPMANTIGTADIARKAVVTGYADKVIDGSRIRASDRRILLNADTLTAKPTTEDELMIDSERHVIIDVKPVPAAGTVAVYILQARSAGQL